MKKKILSVLVALTVVASLTACSSKKAENSDNNNQKNPSTTTIKVFSNQTDRKTGQGLIEQTLFDNYMKENPNVKIEVEALDDEAYKTKFKAYASGNSLPDLVNAWGQPSFLNEVIDAGILAELNKDDYKDYGFIDGSLEGFSKDGKLYGLPRNTDVMAFYYNKAIFKKNGWEVPKTYADLITLAGKIKAKGLIPCSMDGSDKWPLSIFMNDLVAKLEGDYKTEYRKSIESGDFSNPSYKKAAELLQEAVKAGLFQSGFETSDYGTSLNLFANGQAAMYYMGSWEMSMATNPDVIPEVRDNIGVFMMPVVDGGKGKVTDIAAWNGGGYAVTANSKVKDEAIKLLNYMFKQDNWSKLAWENGVCMSAQDYSAYLTGKETAPQKAFTDIVTGSTSITGVTFNDLGTSEFKSLSEDLSQMLAIGSIKPDEFIKNLEEATK
ncbi:ABC transporter substrate-binding protein [Anaeromicropila herbilytica]|uniref:ABC transporter substrate-binding protein n=1 Tax=Anaeromicropila herbilytica TaxID=2785025 RepID=A0A7R7ID78_9FIRM|nr:extracellular solute-binding protein [Anaeromicropila herbilytica]BCN30636.1 ABC transporter substrate-binding protein [Anaeromicropila herbilytica]